MHLMRSLLRTSELHNGLRCARSKFSCRKFSSSKILLDSVKQETSISHQKEQKQIQTSFAEKTKENVKTAGYGGVVLVGIGITGILFYKVFEELFSSSSPIVLFQKASEQCIADPKIQDLLGEPIKAFGEETRRGRRRHVSHLEYQDDQGRKGVRVKFYLQGLRKRGTAQLDVREDSSGKMKTRFLIVTADDLLRTTVVLEDNR